MKFFREILLPKNTTLTILTKAGILLVNLAIVILSTHLWGGAGRGEIALIIANIYLITLLTNIFCGSTISYHTPRVGFNILLIISVSGALLFSLIGATLFSVLIGNRYFLYLFCISLILSLTSSISSYWLGRSDFKIYNLLSILQPSLILASLVSLYFIFKKTSLDTYFVAYIIGTALLLIIGLFTILSLRPSNYQKINFSLVRSMLGYGLNSEINSFIQFFTYRLSYFYIAKYMGLTRLGIFSVAIAIAEGFWVISRSLSAIHYSNVLNSDDRVKSRFETSTLVRQSLLITFALLCISALIPESFYRFIFGREFGEIKKIILFLIPGIVSVAASNLYDQYFSGIGILSVIRFRSLFGLGIIVLMMPILIIRYQLTGICISINVAYILSTVYIWFRFKKEISSGEVIAS